MYCLAMMLYFATRTTPVKILISYSIGNLNRYSNQGSVIISLSRALKACLMLIMYVFFKALLLDFGDIIQFIWSDIRPWTEPRVVSWKDKKKPWPVNLWHNFWFRLYVCTDFCLVSYKYIGEPLHDQGIFYD